MRLVLVTPAWRRFDVTRVALAQRAHLRDVLAGQGVETEVLVVADDDNLDIAREFGFATLEVTNEPLGRKWNDGIEDACTYLEADFVAVVGSDDWIHEDLFTRWPEDVAPDPPMDQAVAVWHRGPEVITGQEIAVMDLASGRLKRCRGRGRYGVIPWIFPRIALEPSSFRPASDNLARGLDGSMVAGLNCRANWVFHDPHDLCRVDFKSAVNLNSFDAITAAIGYGDVETDPWPLLAERYPAHLVEQARRLSSEMRSDPLAVAA